MLTKRLYHLAGIIPVEPNLIIKGKRKREIEKYRILHPALTPVAKNLTALEYAILAALEAGCRTLWLVMDSYNIPMFRAIFGEWIYDSKLLDFGAMSDGLPIYYVPLPISKYSKCFDKMTLGILRGIKTARKISQSITHWAKPDGYFISFPCGLCDMETIKKNRKNFQKHFRVFMSYKNQTIRNNLFLPFIINNHNDLERIESLIASKLKEHFKRNSEFIEVSLENFIKSCILPAEDDKNIEVDWYYLINNWESYSEYVSARKTLERPSYYKFHDLKYKLDTIGNNDYEDQ